MAGARSVRRRKFFTEHPKCCFCGGAEEASTEDHVPGRALFLGRIWPNSYVFPACERCNNETSRDEALLAWLVRIRLTELSPEAEREFERYTFELTRSFPEIWKGLNIHSRVETRRYLKEMRLSATSLGVGGDVVHSMDLPSQVLQVAERYGAKLGKALHYRHSGRIAPADAVVDSRVFTNANALGPQFPSEALTIITNEVEIQRAMTSLKEQFDYRFVVVEQGAASAFVATFGESMVIVVSVFENRERHEKSRATRLLNQLAIGEKSFAPPT